MRARSKEETECDLRAINQRRPWTYPRKIIQRGVEELVKERNANHEHEERARDRARSLNSNAETQKDTPDSTQRHTVHSVQDRLAATYNSTAYKTSARDSQVKIVESK